MTGLQGRNLIRASLVLLGLFSLAASGVRGGPFPRGEEDRSITFYVA